MDMLLNMPKLSKKLKKLKKEGGPQFLSLTCYLQVKWLVQPSLVFDPPPRFSGSQIQDLRSSGQILKCSICDPEVGGGTLTLIVAFPFLLTCNL